MAFGVLPSGVWDVATLDWVRMTQPGGSGGGTGLTDTELRASEVGVVDNSGNLLLGIVATNQGSQQTTLGAIQTNTALSLTQTDFAGKTGIVTETVPASDTASSGLNGRLQRVAQRLTSLIALLPASLVSGRLDVNLGASSITVPVSGTVTTTPPTNASTNIAQLAGTTTSVNSGAKDAGTLRVVLATDQPALANKLLVTPDSVALPANQSVNVSQMAGVAPTLNTGVRDAGTQRVTIATNDVVPVTGTFFQATQPVSLASAPTTAVTNAGLTNLDVALSTRLKPADTLAAVTSITNAVTVTQATLTKGTQGATGVSCQDLKDAGRNQTNYFMVAGIAGTAVEVMQTLVGYKAGAAVGTTVSPAVVTAGKTYRINSITVSYQSLATAGGVVFRLRANLSGAGVVGSPQVMAFTIGSTAAVAGITTTEVIMFPDGVEFPAGTGIAVGMLGLSVVGAALAAGFGTITITGYEY